jgi:hypothetical protein
MDIRPKFIVNQYNNIESEHEIINGWKAEDEFPYNKVSGNHREYLQTISVMEIIFSREYDYRITLDSLFQEYEKFVDKIITLMTFKTYVVISDFKAEKINRLRSYKGILPKGIKEYGVQKEITISDGLSIIIGFVEVNQTNFKKTLKCFTEGEAIFMINTPSNMVNDKSLEHIVRKCMNHNGRSVINFISLIYFFNDADDIVFRMGGDGGDRYVSLQIFCCKNKVDFIRQIITETKTALQL